MPATNSRCLFIGIAVGHPAGLHPLPGVYAALDAMAGWAQARGDAVLQIDDRTVDAAGQRASVSADDIRALVEPYLAPRTGQLDRVTAYFAGHGHLIGGEPVWVLSQGQTLSHHRVAVDAFRAALETYGARQISLISDACKTAAHFPTQAEAGLRESGAAPHLDLEHDRIFATQDGRAAYAANHGETLLFSTVFQRFLGGEFPEALDVINNGQVTSRTIKLGFRKRFERELAAMGVFQAQTPSIHAGFQHPDNVYSSPPPPPEDTAPARGGEAFSPMVQVDPILGDDAPVFRPVLPAHSPDPSAEGGFSPAIDPAAPPEPAPSARRGADRTLKQRLGDASRTRAGQAAGEAWSALGAINRGWDIALVTDLSAPPPALAVRDALAATPAAPGRAADTLQTLPDAGPARLATVSGRNAHALLEVQLGEPPDELTLWLPRYRGLTLQMTVSDNTDSAPRASDQSRLIIRDLSWRDRGGARAGDDVKPWRVLTAFLANKLQPEDVDRLAEQLRAGKHIDPMRGVICAYLYDRIGAHARIAEMAAFYPRFGQAVPFDIALLARAPLHWRAGRGWQAVLADHDDAPVSVGGLAPWLSAGWARLAASANRQLNLLGALQGHLSPQAVAALAGPDGQAAARALIARLEKG